MTIDRSNQPQIPVYGDPRDVWHRQEAAGPRRTDTPNPAHRATIDRLTAALPELETTAQDSRAAAKTIRTGTIDRILAMDDAELGLAVLSGKGVPGQR